MKEEFLFWYQHIFKCWDKNKTSFSKTFHPLSYWYSTDTFQFDAAQKLSCSPRCVPLSGSLRTDLFHLQRPKQTSDRSRWLPSWFPCCSSWTADVPYHFEPADDVTSSLQVLRSLQTRWWTCRFSQDLYTHNPLVQINLLFIPCFGVNHWFWVKSSSFWSRLCC